MRLGRHLDAVEVARDAVTCAARVGAADLESRSRTVLGMSLRYLGHDAEVSLVELDRAVDLAERAGDGHAVIAAHYDRLLVLLDGVVDAAAIDAAIARFTATAEQLDVLDAALPWIGMCRAGAAYLAGDWDAVEDVLGPDELVLTARATVRIARGRLAEGEADLAEAAGAWAEVGPDTLLLLLWPFVEAALIRSRPDEALDRIEEVERPIDATDAALSRAEVAALGLRVAADLAATGRAAGAADRVARAEEAAGRFRRTLEAADAGTLVPGMGTGAEICVLVAWGRAEASRLSGHSDAAAWAAAAARLDRWREPALPPYARCREAEALLAAGERSTAIALLRAARDRATAPGAVLVLGAIASLAEGEALDLTGS